MKTTKTIFKYFALFVVFGIMSCGSDDDAAGSGTPPGGGNGSGATATSITVASASTALTVGDSATFTVTDNLGNDVSSNAVLTIDGVVITSPYVFNTVGTFVVTVTSGGLTTTITIVVTAAGSGGSGGASTRTFTTKMIISDFTGTWCGACSTAGVKIHSTTAANNKVLAIAYHNDDSMSNADALVVETAYNVNAFPTVKLNGNADWTWSSMPLAELDPFLNAMQQTGLAINSTVSGNNLDITVKVGFANITNTNLKLTVWLLEDGKVASQSNYYEPGGNPLANYVHNDIARKAYTAPMGDVIPAASIVVDADYTKSFTGVAIPAGVDTSKLRILAIVSDTSNNVLNVQTAATGTNKDFD